MKANHLSRSLLAAIGGSILAISSASAQLFWSGDAVTQGGSGTWNTTDERWGTDASGPFTSAWTDGNAANFGGTAGTVTLGTPISVTTLTLTDGYEITGNTLTFSTRNIDVTGTATISSAVAGNPTSGILVGAGGTLILSGTNTFDGIFTAYQASTVRFSGTNSNTGENRLAAGARFQFDNVANNGGLGTGNVVSNNDTINYFQALGADHVLTNTFQFSAGGNRMQFDGDYSISLGAVTTTTGTGNRTILNEITAPGKTLTIASYARSGSAVIRAGGAGTTIVTGDISTGASTFTKLDSGTLILLGNHATTSNLTISGGTYQVGDGGTTGTIATTATINNNATLAFNRSNTVEQGTDFGTIGGTGGVTQMGSGTLILSGTNTYTGETLVNAGTLVLNGTVGGITVESGAALTPGGGSATLTTNGTVTFEPGAIFAAQIDSAAATSGRIFANADVTLTGAILSLSDIAGTPAAIPAATKLVLIDYDTFTLTGTFDGLPEGSTVSAGINSFTLSYADGGFVTLTALAGSDPFATWALGAGLDGSPGKEAGFDGDPDGDGVANGLEWILGGNPLDGKSSSLVATAATAANGLTLSFTRNEDSIGQATLTVEYNTDLGAAWQSAAIGATSSGPDANDVTVTIDTATSPDQVTVNIPASNAPNGRLFARLNAQTAP